MDIQSVTANPLPAAVVQPGGKAPAQPEVRAGNLPAAETRSPENAPQARRDNRENEEEVRTAVDNIERFVAQSTRDITFSIDKDAGFTVKVIDRTSHDVIRQIPSEEVVAIARALDKLQGLFVRDKI
ncbi:flagellar protein FlaG [Azonexus sp.]|jgi:flagellar protein FlaG|uniref:flagellar protein FlaG n=1 Tax=Azonexus sp. TaxID=1872668 RepID=UPI0028257BE4|nr:flagellar protein FlaG [Azonexus sp.]MDR1995088.1 flagellar protein FlaG [Azonexus sp.]